MEDAVKFIRQFDIKKKYNLPIRIAKSTGNEVLYIMAQKKALKNSEIYRYIHSMPVEVCLYLMAKTNLQTTKMNFSLYFTKLKNAKIHITGNDLIKLGIKPGKIFKEILDTLLDEVLNSKIECKEDELKFIKKKYHKRVA
jgi:tRNA nucleotidyltransferase (CCA-adding enzyme)